MGVKTATRRLLSRRVSVADVVEFGLWLGIPYVIVGLVFAFFSIEQKSDMSMFLRVRRRFPSKIAAGRQMRWQLQADEVATS